MTETTPKSKAGCPVSGSGFETGTFKDEAGVVQIVADFQHRIVVSVLQYIKYLELNPVTFHCRQSS
jgi:hypothetical protein